MRVITEAELRDQYKKTEFTSYRIPADTGLTPSAKQFLNDRKINILTGDRDEPEQAAGRHFEDNDSEGGYSVLATGEKLAEKPEHMTHIYGRNLVPKNHPRIKCRGKLDHLQALIINLIIEVESNGYRELAGDLAEMLEYSRQIMGAEVKGEPLASLTFQGLSQAEIREHSHHPRRFYGISHFFPQPQHGRVMAGLNLLRTEARELELAAMDAFYGQPEGQGRADILQSLNRLSSLVYIFMLRLASGRYKVGS